MLTKSSMAFISGWGLKSSLFKESSLYFRGSLLIDLPDIEELTLERVVHNLSYLIPDDTTVIGWSFGGLIGILLATLFPKKVKKLILLSSSPRFIQRGRWPGISLSEANKFINLAKRSFSNLFNYFLALVNYPNRTVYYKRLLINNSINFSEYHDLLLKYLKILFESDVREAYKRIKIPLFHVFGEQDPIIQLNPKALYNLNPSAVIHVIPESGHLAFLIHEKSYYNQLTNFINHA
ncbi:MAG: alpha/beta fold hydrolase [Coxiella endosymbiont of Dermacentor silvarum]